MRLIDRMAVGLAGRVAEEMVYGDIGDGASADLRAVTELAEHMVCRLGMGRELGPVFVGEAAASPSQRQLSPETRRVVDEDVRNLIAEADERVRRVLVERRADLDRIADALIEQETVTSAELARMVAPVTPLRAARRAGDAGSRASPLLPHAG